MDIIDYLSEDGGVGHGFGLHCCPSLLLVLSVDFQQHKRRMRKQKKSLLRDSLYTAIIRETWKQGYFAYVCGSFFVVVVVFVFVFCCFGLFCVSLS